MTHPAFPVPYSYAALVARLAELCVIGQCMGRPIQESALRDCLHALSTSIAPRWRLASTSKGTLLYEWYWADGEVGGIIEFVEYVP